MSEYQDASKKFESTLLCSLNEFFEYKLILQISTPASLDSLLCLFYNPGIMFQHEIVLFKLQRISSDLKNSMFFKELSMFKAKL